jgi:hypothetical protein
MYVQGVPGLENSAQQRTAFCNDPTEVLYWIRLKASTEIYTDNACYQDDLDEFRRQQQARARVSLNKKCVDCITGITGTNKIMHRLLPRIICVVLVMEPTPKYSIAYMHYPANHTTVFF